MRRIFIVLILVNFYVLSNAKEADFSFEYPDSIKENADVIMLFNDIVYERTSLSAITKHVHYAITIPSERGDNYNEFVIAYDGFSKIRDLNSTIYDKNGKKVRKIKSSDIQDYSAYSSSSFFDDNRLVYFKANHPEYPYTVEVEYEKEYDGFLTLTPWFPVGAYNIGIKSSSLTVISPSSLELVFKEINNEHFRFSKAESNSKTILKWEASCIKPIEYERFARPLIDQIPLVYLAPVQFKYDGSKGEFSSWESLGIWNYKLLESDYDLSEKTIADLEAIKQKSKNKTDLVKRVYKYMQSKTRYVGIQLGIGGFKPMSPTLVDEVGYGDCKALSYYTKALLNQVGVNSEYTIIGVNRTKLKYEDFVSVVQMNHAILCVPNGSDSIWLECTSQIAPFNHLFDGSTSRKALLIKNEGSNLVTTPNYNKGSIVQQGKVTLDGSGNLFCEKSTIYSGSYYDDYYWLKEYSDKELREYVLKKSVISDMSIQHLQVAENVSNEIPELELKNEFKTSNYASIAGNRIFVEMNLFSILSQIAPQNEERRNSVYIQNDIIYEDHIDFEIPEGYHIEFCPENNEVDTKYGSYDLKIIENEKSVNYIRVFKINKGEYPKEEYPVFIKFMNDMADNEDCKLILKK